MKKQLFNDVVRFNQRAMAKLPLEFGYYMRYLLVLLFGVVLAFRLEAQSDVSERDNTPKYSNEFMNIGVSARSFGMGFTGVSFIDDVTAGYWNPAGLNSLSATHQLSLMHSSYFGGLANYDYAAFATSVDDQSKISLSVIRFAVDDIQSEIKRLQKEGFTVLNETPKKGADNKLVAFLHPKTTNGVLIELCEEVK